MRFERKLWLLNIVDGKIKRGDSQLNNGEEAHSSEDVWRSTSSDARWTEVTKEMDHLQRVIHEKQITRSKSLKEISKRDNDLTRTIEDALDEESEEYKDKCALEQLRRQLCTEEESR